ncbi:hypothetical protein DVT68_03130 [Dyella solisilvae]|uniref:EF-hand domain-containing protein n=1 Tax=Dyella solisilvae TaxID=1920168 RepID=A0A370KCK7_9GAMM|nr:hypothetical protein [Dyella solisilvae]RDI99840.1 hypothetical protein DVT68_03130 [Dyella solisilvae]
MKARIPILTVVTAGSLMLAGSLLAQTQSMPTATQSMPTATQSMPTSSPPANATTLPSSAPTPPPPPGGTQAQFNSPQGKVIINSEVPQVAAGPAPSFDQLSGGARYITEDQASAYPPLANDFLYVDKGKTGHITRAEYEHWVENK